MHPDQKRFLQYLSRHAINGVLLGWTILGAIIVTDTAGLKTLITLSGDGVVAMVLLAAGFAVTFGSLMVGSAVFLLPWDNDDDDSDDQGGGGGGGRWQAHRWQADAGDRALIPIPVRNGDGRRRR